MLTYFRSYIQLRPSDAPPRLFLGLREGKCIRQPIGVNSIASYPLTIAKFLGLPDAHHSLSHALRRTAATWISDSGIDTINLKRFGGWKSDSAAHGYIAESKAIRECLQQLFKEKVQ